MAFQINEIEQFTHEGIRISYFFSIKHRGNPTYEISIWEIDFKTEYDCFVYSYRMGWVVDGTGWGYILNNEEEFEVIGRNLKNIELRIAKFVSDDVQWHGYPADIRNKPRDKPHPAILKSWTNEKVIKKAIMSRIKQGQL